LFARLTARSIAKPAPAALRARHSDAITDAPGIVVDAAYGLASPGFGAHVFPPATCSRDALSVHKDTGYSCPATPCAA
ncbi:MAG: hypothetical protein OWT27_06950, partial [Firmicutes bacterium]|nr:hypothetical protein [Bacillota bacterium]